VTLLHHDFEVANRPGKGFAVTCVDEAIGPLVAVEIGQLGDDPDEGTTRLRRTMNWINPCTVF